MRPRITQAEFNLPPPPPPSYALVRVPRTHHLTKHKDSRPLLFMPYGEAYTQAPNLPKLAGQVGFAGDPLPRGQHSGAEAPSFTEETQFDLVDASYTLGFPAATHGILRLETMRLRNYGSGLGGKIRSSLAYSPRTWSSLPRRGRCQTSTTSPSLYVRAEAGLVQSLQQLCHLQVMTLHARKCRGLTLPPLAVQTIQYQRCDCLPMVADQVIVHGLFPCAPIEPSLLVDMRLLEFASRLFLQVPPNNTGWCKALGDFLTSLGFGLGSEVR